MDDVVDHQGKSRTWPFFFFVKPSIYISNVDSAYPLAFLKLFIILHYTPMATTHTFLPSLT